VAQETLTRIPNLASESVRRLVSVGDVVDLILNDLEAALHPSDDGVVEHLLPSRTEDPLAQVDVVVV
jgi:hypothetical protein